MSQFKVVLGCPSYDGTRHDGSCNGIRFATKRYPTKALQQPSSLMCRNFNILYAMALEQRDLGQATHFAMLHADVEPEAFWLDTLMDVMDSRGVDIVSAIIPVKQMVGLTSTAIEHATNEWGVERRLTMHEVMKLPVTFGTEICPGRKLLLNDGLMLVDLRGEWADQESVCFHTPNRIVREKQPDGKMKRIVECVSEDWYFSREAQRHGAKVVATRKVPVMHHGGHGGFANTMAWGEWEFDREYATRPLEQAELTIETITPERLREVVQASKLPAPRG